MSQITRTYTFVDGQTAYGSQVETEFGIVATAINNLDSGSASWGTVTCSGTITANGKLVGKGTATNDSAAAGYIGEYISSEILFAGRVSSSGSNQAFDVANISLTAGDWDVQGIIVANAASATITLIGGWASSVSGNDTTDSVGLRFGQLSYVAAIANDTTVCFPARQISLSATTTIYLKAYLTYTGGPGKAYGGIAARRRR